MADVNVAILSLRLLGSLGFLGMAASFGVLWIRTRGYRPLFRGRRNAGWLGLGALASFVAAVALFGLAFETATDQTAVLVANIAVATTTVSFSVVGALLAAATYRNSSPPIE